MATALIGGATVVGGTIAAAPSASAAPVQSAQIAAGGSVWDRVAACESGGNWRIATGNGYYGGLQFSASSWRAAGGTRYASLPHKASKAQQIAAAKNLLRMQGPGAWPVCSRKAGLTRANGAAAGGGSVGQAASRSSARSAAVRVKDPLTRAQVRKLQARVGARVDGIVGPETVRKTERALGFRASGKSYLAGSTLRGARVLI